MLDFKTMRLIFVSSDYLYVATYRQQHWWLWQHYCIVVQNNKSKLGSDDISRFSLIKCKNKF